MTEAHRIHPITSAMNDEQADGMKPYCDHDYPERDGRCMGCREAVGGDALTIAEQARKITHYREALRKYGQHLPSCNIGRFTPMTPCSCGLVAALEASHG